MKTHAALLCREAGERKAGGPELTPAPAPGRSIHRAGGGQADASGCLISAWSHFLDQDEGCPQDREHGGWGRGRWEGTGEAKAGDPQYQPRHRVFSRAGRTSTPVGRLCHPVWDPAGLSGCFFVFRITLPPSNLGGIAACSCSRSSSSHPRATPKQPPCHTREGTALTTAGAFEGRDPTPPFQGLAPPQGIQTLGGLRHQGH